MHCWAQLKPPMHSHHTRRSLTPCLVLSLTLWSPFFFPPSMAASSIAKHKAKHWDDISAAWWCEWNIGTTRPHRRWLRHWHLTILLPPATHGIALRWQLRCLPMRASDIPGMLQYQAIVSIRCNFLLPLRSTTILLILEKWVNRSLHVHPKHTIFLRIQMHTNNEPINIVALFRLTKN
jgi:hypothetical protein